MCTSLPPPDRFHRPMPPEFMKDEPPASEQRPTSMSPKSSPGGNLAPSTATHTMQRSTTVPISSSRSSTEIYANKKRASAAPPKHPGRQLPRTGSLVLAEDAEVAPDRRGRLSWRRMVPVRRSRSDSPSTSGQAQRDESEQPRASPVREVRFDGILYSTGCSVTGATYVIQMMCYLDVCVVCAECSRSAAINGRGAWQRRHCSQRTRCLCTSAYCTPTRKVDTAFKLAVGPRTR